MIPMKLSKSDKSIIIRAFFIAFPIILAAIICYASIMLAPKDSDRPAQSPSQSEIA